MSSALPAPTEVVAWDMVHGLSDTAYSPPRTPPRAPTAAPAVFEGAGVMDPAQGVDVMSGTALPSPSHSSSWNVWGAGAPGFAPLPAENARRISVQRADSVPEPPKVLRDNLPPHPGLLRNLEWLKAHAEQYQGLWVALRDGELVAAAKTGAELRARLAGQRGLHILRLS